MIRDDEHPINRYLGMNPDFVHEVWRKRRAEELVTKQVAQAERCLAKKVVTEQRLLRKDAEAALKAERAHAAENIGKIAASEKTGKEIIKAVCDKYGVPVEKVLAGRGDNDIVKVRWAAMAEVRTRTNYNYHAIGRLFGRDHSSVMHAMRKMGVGERKVAS